MKRFGVCAAALPALLLAMPAGAQVRFPDPTTLVAPGATIGVRVRDVSAEDLKQARLETSTGVYIEEVIVDTPADRAGLKRGDIVTEFDGERVRGVRSFTRLVAETPPRRTVKATVIRDGARQTLEVTPEPANAPRASSRLPILPRDLPQLRQLPQFRDLPRLPLTPDLRRFDARPSSRRLGVTISALSDQLAAYFGVSSGLLVSAVETGSPAARAGVKAGDVISAVNGRPVRQPVDLNEAVRDTPEGGMLELKVVRDRQELTLRVAIDRSSADGASDRVPV